MLRMNYFFQKNFVCLLWNLCFVSIVCAQSLSPATHLKASKNSSTYILLTCRHPNFTASTSLTIYRNTAQDFETAQVIVQDHQNLKFFDRDPNLKAEIWYYYWILEANPATGAKSKPSDMVKGKKVAQLDRTLRADVILLPPTEVKASDALNSIQLSWNCPSVYAEGETIQHCDSIILTKSKTIVNYSYLIYRSEFFDVNTAIPIAEVTENIFTDEDSMLRPNTIYYYRIQVIDNQGHESGFSRPVKGQKTLQTSRPTGDLSVPTDPNDLKFGNTFTSRKKALVIGISDYPYMNPSTRSLKDAPMMANLLRKHHWDVMGREDLQTKASFENTLQDFIAQASLKTEDTLLIYYSGYAISYNGAAYLIPKQANIRQASDIPAQAFALDGLLKPLMNKCQVQLVLLDAAYNERLFGNTGIQIRLRDNIQNYTKQLYQQNHGKLLIAHALPTDALPTSQQLSPFTSVLHDILRRDPCTRFEDALQSIGSPQVSYWSNGVKVSVKNCD
jgi:hypothetical protein